MILLVRNKFKQQRMISNSHQQCLSEESEAMSLLAENLLKLKQQMTGESPQISSPPNSSSPRSSAYTSPQHHLPEQSPLASLIHSKYQKFLSSLTPQFRSMSYDQKICHLLEQRQLGSTIYLFQLIYYFREALSEEALTSIAQQLMQSLNLESEAEIRCSFELLAYIGVADEEMVQNVQKLMLEESLPVDIGVLYLVNMGIRGMEVLAEIVGGDFKGVSMEVLGHLARSETIMQEILIPTLANDICTGDNKKRTTALAALNRFFHLTSDPKITSSLAKLLEDGNIDRSLLASTLRSSGPEGEKELIKYLKSSKNNKHKLPILSVMPWRVPHEMEMEIQVVEYSIASGFSPGTMYRYEGSLQPAAYSEDKEENTLYLNSRDFLAALNRLVVSGSGESSRDNMRASEFNCCNLSLIMNFIREKERMENPQVMSEEVIKTLASCLSNPIVEVREAALNSLGLIGLPEAAETVQKVFKCLSDPESRNRSMACWTLSKICQNPSAKILKRLAQLLKDSFWKVRTSVCLTISSIVSSPTEPIIEGLVRSLKQGSINRETVCETLIKLGAIGEEVLLEILKNTHLADSKIKSSIINSFQFADVGSPSIDYIIEEVFKHCSDENPVIRALCLECLNALRLRSTEENITYLKAKNILPLFYYFLEDPSSKLRELAVEAILSFGSHAQLIFIQGVTKSLNPVVRCESVKGLSRLGAQNFRAILFGLRDQDQRVRRSTSSCILSHLPLQQVVREFQFKQNHIPTLVCHLKEILEGSGVCPQLREYLGLLLSRLSSKKVAAKKTPNDQNIQLNH